MVIPQGRGTRARTEKGRRWGAASLGPGWCWDSPPVSSPHFQCCHFLLKGYLPRMTQRLLGVPTSLDTGCQTNVSRLKTRCYFKWEKKGWQGRGAQTYSQPPGYLCLRARKTPDRLSRHSVNMREATKTTPPCSPLHQGDTHFSKTLWSPSRQRPGRKKVKP